MSRERQLNSAVTAAIFDAERLTLGTPEADAAYTRVMELEEELSTVTKPDTVEGTACRLGAVAAALKARRPSAALALARTYLSENLDPELRGVMELRRDAALAALHEALADA